MIATVPSATLLGVEGQPVSVEVHIGNGLPSFTVVGLPDAACRESRDRVRAAFASTGLDFPKTRITVNLVCPAADLGAVVDAWARRLAAGPTVALSLTKSLLNNAFSTSIDQALEDEARSQHITYSTEDAKEALAAFVGKREPSFKGR